MSRGHQKNYYSLSQIQKLFINRSWWSYLCSKCYSTVCNCRWTYYSNLTCQANLEKKRFQLTLPDIVRSLVVFCGFHTAPMCIPGDQRQKTCYKNMTYKRRLAARECRAKTNLEDCFELAETKLRHCIKFGPIFAV